MEEEEEEDYDLPGWSRPGSVGPTQQPGWQQQQQQQQQQNEAMDLDLGRVLDLKSGGPSPRHSRGGDDHTSHPYPLPPAPGPGSGTGFGFGSGPAPGDHRSTCPELDLVGDETAAGGVSVSQKRPPLQQPAAGQMLPQPDTQMMPDSRPRKVQVQIQVGTVGGSR